MARFRLLLEYEGTRYSGWQVQKNARTIQGELLRVMRDVFKTADLELQGAGRTDAGVHAEGQVAHLDVQTVLAPEIIRMKLNDLLPPDINILEIEKAPLEFHARHDAIEREYVYRISRRRTAFGKRYVWWVKEPLDVGAIRKAAASFTGMKDWRAFTDADPEAGSTKSLIHRISVEEGGELILIRVAGSHFLWKLVRRIVGVLVEVGRGTLHASDLEPILSGGSDFAARHTAPPSGLFLHAVRYPEITGAAQPRRPPFQKKQHRQRKSARG